MFSSPDSPGDDSSDDDDGAIVTLKRTAVALPSTAGKKSRKKNSVSWDLVCGDCDSVEMEKYRSGYTKWRFKNNATTTSSKAVTYGCTLHKDCPAEMRVRYLLPNPATKFEIHKSGIHTGEFSKPAKGGAPEIKSKATEFIMAGIKPVRIAAMLQRDVPSARQPSAATIASLKKAIHVEEEKKFHVDNNVELLSFLEQYKINREEFDVLTDLDRMIVLDFFDIDAVTDDGEPTRAIGFVFSSKRLLNNGFQAYKVNNEEGIILNADGKPNVL